MISDTSPSMQKKFAALMMQKTGLQRFEMGFSMFDTATKLVYASLSGGGDIDKARRQLFLRFYGSDFDLHKREAIINHLQRYACPERDLPEAVAGAIRTVQDGITRKYPPRCIILYGSWVKGTAHEDSDIDLLVVFEELGKEEKEYMNGLAYDHHIDKRIAILPAKAEDFAKEKSPLFTAIKKEGKIIFGNVDLCIDQSPPRIKYADFFRQSRGFETRKVEMARKFLPEGLLSGVPALCFMASKHAVQAALAMEGKGYSSEMAVLLPLAKERFGGDIAEKLSALFNIYTRPEYGMDDINEAEAKTAVESAETVLGVYDSILS